MREELREEALRGAKDVLPILIGVIPFGLVAGATAIEKGLTAWDALGLSTGIFAGASQLAAIQLLGQDAPLAVIVLTVVVINLRMLMYSASLAPALAGTALRTRATAAYFLTDQAYVLTIARSDHVQDRRLRLAYYFGVGIPLWVNWQIMTIVGAVVGAAIPADIPLAFALPLVFLVLLVPALVDRPTVIAAAVAGVAATLLAPLPYNLGLFAGALLGIAAGTATSVRQAAGAEVTT